MTRRFLGARRNWLEEQEEELEEHTQTFWARRRPGGPQNSSLRAFAGKAFTMVLAGFAFTMTTLPKISRFPALVAFFWRVLIMTTPGMTNLPFFFASCVAMLARVLRAVLMTPLFTSQLSARAAVRALLVMTVDFIIGAISAARVRKDAFWSVR